MSEGPELPAWAQPRRPEERPVWVVVLALAMLLFSGKLLIDGLTDLRDPGHPRPFPASRSAYEAQDVQALNQSVGKAYRQHPVAVGAHIASRLVTGVLMLLAVAAVFTSDRRARVATLIAAATGIAHQLGNLVFGFVVFRKGVLPEAAALMNLARRQASAGAVTDPTSVASVVEASIAVVIVGPVLMGILFSLVLLTFFGGRRGRTFFGAGAVVHRQPNHGG